MKIQRRSIQPKQINLTTFDLGVVFFFLDLIYFQFDLETKSIAISEKVSSSQIRQLQIVIDESKLCPHKNLGNNKYIIHPKLVS
jgi:hypothetical protein